MFRVVAFRSLRPRQSYNLHHRSDVYLAAHVLKLDDAKRHAERLFFFFLQILRPSGLVFNINRLENAHDGLFSVRLCIVCTFEPHVGDSCGWGKPDFGYEVTLQVAIATRWLRSSFPPFDEDHVSTATRDEEGLALEDANTAASSQHLNYTSSVPDPFPSRCLSKQNSLSFLSGFYLSSWTPFISSAGPLCLCISICETKSRSRGNLGWLCFYIEVSVSQQD